MLVNIKEKITIGIGIGLSVAVLTGAYYWYKQKVKNAYPKTWRKVGTITKIAISPLKSCQMICLEEAECKLIGIENGQLRDRMFMLIDDQSKVVTATPFPHMLQIKQEICKSGLAISISAPGMESLEIAFDRIGDGKTIRACIYGQDLFVVECDPKYNQWFSKFIYEKENGLRLVYYPFETPNKNILKMLRNGAFLNEDAGGLHDISSYMLINETSVDDLNTRLKRPVDALRFRPNFLVKTDGPAYDEDNWKWIRIGHDAEFRTVFPCLRCILPNIDLETAKRDPDCEPLKTLKTYRINPKWNDGPIMGLQLGLRKSGHVKLGDDVFVGL